jgi:hypothetical protein
MDESLWGLCRDYLIWSAEDIPIISVSQKPVSLGTNICVGEIGRSITSIFMQVLAGALAAETKYVAIAEQDNLYPKGCFSYRPPRDDTFYYNLNFLILHHEGDLSGLYGAYNGFRFSFSQLVCNRELLVKALKWALRIIDEGHSVNHKEGMLVEPGAWKALFKDVEPEYTKYDFYWDRWPSIDIRHSRGFTKQLRKYTILADKAIYWGAPEDIIKKKPMVSPCLEL